MASSDFQSFLDEVVMRNDIVEIISGFTTLKRSGNNMMGLCPLHNDKKSPSLSVSPDKQIFHCFGCGAGGSVIQFVEAAMNLDFMDAVKYLADRAHMEMPSTRGGGDKQKQLMLSKKKERLYQINAMAARYYFDCLSKPEGKPGLDYLRERKLKNSTIKKFGIGYAPEGWTDLYDHLKAQGCAEGDMEDAGLIRRRQNGTYYDAFYDGRVVFPIIDVRGRVIAFGGRIIRDGTDAPKYWNTPETLIFKKKDNLFGLNLAKNDKSGRLLLMEGYMDVVALHQSGFGNAVASLGTAFTPEQARLVKRYAPRAVLCYDNDEAGIKATLRAGDILFDEGVKVRVLTVTDGKDPDEFIKNKGPDMFSVLIERSRPLIEYKIDGIREKYNLNDVDDKVDFTREVSEVLARIKDAAQREIYVGRLADELKISAAGIMAGVSDIELKNAETDQRRRESERLRRTMHKPLPEEKNVRGVYWAERFLLNLMCDKRVIKKVLESGLTPDDFASEPAHKRLAELLISLAESGAVPEPSDIIGRCAPEDAGTVSDILINDKETKDRLLACAGPIGILVRAKEERQRLSAAHDDEQLKLLFDKKKNRKNAAGGAK